MLCAPVRLSTVTFQPPAEHRANPLMPNIHLIRNKLRNRQQHTCNTPAISHNSSAAAEPAEQRSNSAPRCPPVRLLIWHSCPLTSRLSCSRNH